MTQPNEKIMLPMSKNKIDNIAVAVAMVASLDKEAEITESAMESGLRAGELEVNQENMSALKEALQKL